MIESDARVCAAGLLHKFSSTTVAKIVAVISVHVINASAMQLISLLITNSATPAIRRSYEHDTRRRHFSLENRTE